MLLYGYYYNPQFTGSKPEGPSEDHNINIRKNRLDPFLKSKRLLKF